MTDIKVERGMKLIKVLAAQNQNERVDTDQIEKANNLVSELLEDLNPQTTHPVIALMPDQNGIEDIGGTLRLGSYPCVLDPSSKAYQLYGTDHIEERHRHRYEVNNDYRKALTDHGLSLSGLSPDGRIVEMVELKQHPFFIGTQGHPELKSRPNRPHPLFKGFVEASLQHKEKR